MPKRTKNRNQKERRIRANQNPRPRQDRTKKSPGGKQNRARSLAIDPKIQTDRKRSNRFMVHGLSSVPFLVSHKSVVLISNNNAISRKTATVLSGQPAGPNPHAVNLLNSAILRRAVSQSSCAGHQTEPIELFATHRWRSHKPSRSQ